MSKKNARIVVKDIRLSYAYLSEPVYDETKDTHSYRTMILIKKNHPQMKAIKKLIQQAAVNKFGLESAKKLLRNPKFHMPIRDPEIEEFDGEEFKGNVFFNSKTGVKPRPGVMLVNGTKLKTAEDIAEHIYSGCWGHISVTFFGFDHPTGGKGVACALNNFMKTKDDAHLDGSMDAADEFADLVDEDSDLGMDDMMDGDDDGLDMDDDGASDDDWEL